MKGKKKSPGRGGGKTNKPLPSIPKQDVMSSAILALKAEAAENRSTCLTVFYTDGKPSGYTTGHSRSRRSAGASMASKRTGGPDVLLAIA